MRVLFFAHLKAVAGCDTLDLHAPAPLDAAQFWTELLARIPALAPHRRSVRLARNLEYAAPDTRFGDSDEVALIPPVSGG
jgi:molybdopterin converting factor subunit 1